MIRFGIPSELTSEQKDSLLSGGLDTSEPERQTTIKNIDNILDFKGFKRKRINPLTQESIQEDTNLN